MSVEEMLGEAYARLDTLQKERDKAQQELNDLRDTMRQAITAILVDVSATKRALGDMAASWRQDMPTAEMPKVKLK